MMEDLAVQKVNTPKYITPTWLCTKLYGFPVVELKFHPEHNMFGVIENSGIVRFGVSLEFYNKRKDYFKVR